MPAEPQNSAQVDCCASDGRILARIRLWPTRDTGLTGEAHPLVRWPEARIQRVQAWADAGLLCAAADDGGV